MDRDIGLSNFNNVCEWRNVHLSHNNQMQWTGSQGHMYDLLNRCPATDLER